jgi:hypothetical protein
MFSHTARVRVPQIEDHCLKCSTQSGSSHSYSAETEMQKDGGRLRREKDQATFCSHRENGRLHRTADLKEPGYGKAQTDSGCVREDCRASGDESETKSLAHPRECSRQGTSAGGETPGRNRKSVKFEVFTAVTVKNAVFWDVTACGSCKNRSFGGT